MSKREAVATGVTRLCEWAASGPAIPREVMERAVRVLADDMSAIVGARNEPEVFAFQQKIPSAKNDRGKLAE